LRDKNQLIRKTGGGTCKIWNIKTQETICLKTHKTYIRTYRVNNQVWRSPIFKIPCTHPPENTRNYAEIPDSCQLLYPLLIKKEAMFQFTWTRRQKRQLPCTLVYGFHKKGTDLETIKESHSVAHWYTKTLGCNSFMALYVGM